MERKNKNAFTLIELLAVIVILAIIALIATPIILGIVEDAKKDAFLRSVELVISTTDIDIANKTFEEEYTYDIVEGNISNLEISVKNTEGMNGNITYDIEGKEEYAIHNGVYCVKKTQDMSKAEISDYEGYCGFETSQKCFAFSNGTITNYYDNEENDSSKKECPRNVIIPEIINGITVTKIGNSAFKSKNITSVKFPDGVVDIGMSAFENNKISGELDLSNTSLETIKNYVFQGKSDGSTNQITSLKLPSSVTKIFAGAFDYNKISGELDLSHLTKLTSVSGFYHNEITSIKLPDSLTSVSGFGYNEITSIKLPDNITSIGTGAFENNKLSGELDLGTYPNLQSIGERAFYQNDITSIELPKNITSIGGYAFSSNKLSGELDLSNTQITNIGNSAFAANPSGTTNQLDNIKLPSTLISIGEFCFYFNYLTSVTFYGRSDLTGVTVGTAAWSWASGYSDANIYFVNE